MLAVASKRLDEVFARSPGTGALTLGAEVDRWGAGTALRYSHRWTKRAGAFAEGFVERPWAGDINYGARGGLEVRF